MGEWDVFSWHTFKTMDLRRDLDTLRVDVMDNLPSSKPLEEMDSVEVELEYRKAMEYARFSSLMYINALREGLLEVEKRLDGFEESLKRRYP